MDWEEVFLLANTVKIENLSLQLHGSKEPMVSHRLTITLPPFLFFQPSSQLNRCISLTGRLPTTGEIDHHMHMIWHHHKSRYPVILCCQVIKPFVDELVAVGLPDQVKPFIASEVIKYNPSS